MTYDCAIIGGGIVGLATAMTLLHARPGLQVLVLEKESDIAQHQTGRNSGVIHSGIYYKPGSLKAAMARDGNRSMREFCQTHGLAHEICGKLILATDERELPMLENLRRRGIENELAVERISPAAARDIEPHVRCLGALRVPGTGIVSYRDVSRKYAELIREDGGELRFTTRVQSIRDDGVEQIVATDRDEVRARFVVNCGG